MIEGIVKKIMVGGIEKYAKLHNVQPEVVQIKVINNDKKHPRLLYHIYLYEAHTKMKLII